MMTMTLQDAAVAAFAIAGAAVLLRRVIKGMRPSASGAACPSCASGAAACAKPAPATPPHASSH
jgi:hypothetical protein